jgi:hypothetical protein
LYARMLDTSADFADFFQFYNPYIFFNLRNLWILISITSLATILYLGLLEGLYAEIISPAGGNLRCALFGFVFIGLGRRLFFAENPGTDNAELIHYHQR